MMISFHMISEWLFDPVTLNDFKQTAYSEQKSPGYKKKKKKKTLAKETKYFLTQYFISLLKEVM